MRIILQSSACLASVIILLAISGTAMGTISFPTSAPSGNTFYFHYNSILYRSRNASITLLSEANLTKPVEVVPQVFGVASSIRNATTPFGTVWVGTVSWISQSLAESAFIQGSVKFNVWLSSNDTVPTFSGIGVGVAVLDARNQTLGSYVYSYSYARGTIVAASPTEYNLSVDLDREVAAGQRLVFAVGVGSTTAGWRVKVYFDAVQYPSRAQLPSSVLVSVIPEFQQVPITLTFVLAILVSLSLLQRRFLQRFS